jgi:hypothetical protein
MVGAALSLELFRCVNVTVSISHTHQVFEELTVLLLFDAVFISLGIFVIAYRRRNVGG